MVRGDGRVDVELDGGLVLQTTRGRLSRVPEFQEESK